MVHVLGVVGWWQEWRKGRIGDQASFWLHHLNIKAEGWRMGTELFCRWLQPAFQYTELSWHEKKYPKKTLDFPRMRLYCIGGMVGAYHMFSSDSIVFIHLAAGCSVWRLFLL